MVNSRPLLVPLRCKKHWRNKFSRNSRRAVGGLFSLAAFFRAHLFLSHFPRAKALRKVENLRAAALGLQFLGAFIYYFNCKPSPADLVCPFIINAAIHSFLICRKYAANQVRFPKSAVFGRGIYYKKCRVSDQKPCIYIKSPQTREFRDNPRPRPYAAGTLYFSVVQRGRFPSGKVSLPAKLRIRNFRPSSCMQSSLPVSVSRTNRRFCRVSNTVTSE